MSQDRFAQRVTQSWVSANPLIQSDDNIFTAPRQTGDIDMVEECRTILLQSGLLAQSFEAYDNDTRIMTAKPLCSQAQRFILNKYWRLQLMLTQESSQKMRFLLLEDGPMQEWLTSFKKGIVPFLVQNQLPRVIE